MHCNINQYKGETGLGDFSEEEYREVIVVAIHMMNLDEMFFERNGAIEKEKYRFLLADCMDILQGTSGLLDIVMSNNSVYAIYNVRAERHCVQHAAASVNRLFEKTVTFGGEDRCPLVYGIGIAIGIAISLRIHEKNGEISRFWLGNGLRRAEAMAQMSVCDGRKQIFLAD